MLHIGANLLTDSTDAHQGVYTFGSKNINYPLSLGFSYTLSIGDQQSDRVKIGTLFPSGRSLYVGWQNGSKYGIDEIAVTNDKADLSTTELLIADVGSVAGSDYPLIARVDHQPLNSGESITVKMKADRADTWTNVYTEDTAGATTTRGTISNKMKEVQIAVDVKTTVATAPDIYEISLEVDSTDGRRI